MPLPAPNLDDRRFQDLVDDAKRLVQQHCPEWSDHNVSDPGVTLIELFAWMTDQLLYRLNRVPDRNYVKFLELIGLRRFAPTAAHAAITFWMSTAVEELTAIPQGTVVATRRTETEDAIEFTTVEELALVPARVLTVRSSTEPDRSVEHIEALMKGTGFSCFSPQPRPGDQLLIGLVDPVPKCAIVIRMRATIEGIGVDPEQPPLVWEAWTGDDWERCEIDSDGTGGINRDGDIVLHVPRTHEASLIAKQRAGWLRARVLEPVENQPFYSASPQIFEITAFTMGGTEEARNATLVPEEYIGNSDGAPRQRFPLEHTNIVATDEAYLEVTEGEGWQRWERVEDFSESGPDDPHYVLDGVDGEVLLGPAVRLEDGSVQQFGKVPAKGATLRLRDFSAGGGARGNVNKGAITILKTTLPYVDRVDNRRSAVGGRDAEDLENAKLRGPILLRTRNRAVTAEDFEFIAGAAAPEIARVRCLPAGTDPAEAGAVRVLIVPDLPDEFGRLRFERLLPAEPSLKRIAQALDARRVIGTRVSVEPPFYQGITVVARIRPRREVHPARLQEQALTALYQYFNPLTGGPEATGWPFGRPIMVGEVYSVLQRLGGVELVDDARLFPADPVTGRRGEATQRIEIDPNALVFSYEHQVLVEAMP